MVNWPLPMLTTVEGEVGIIFSAAEVISELISNMGNLEGEPLLLDWLEWENVDVDGLWSGLVLGNKEDMPVSL